MIILLKNIIRYSYLKTFQVLLTLLLYVFKRKQGGLLELLNKPYDKEKIQPSDPLVSSFFYRLSIMIIFVKEIECSKATYCIWI